MAAHIFSTRKSGIAGLYDVTVLYLFEVSPRIKDTANEDVIPAWDAAHLPANFKDEVSQAWKDGLAAGDAGFHTDIVTQRVGEDLTTLQTYLQTVHFPAIVADVIAKRRAEAAETGEHDLNRVDWSF